jgi:hypothetical protein
MLVHDEWPLAALSAAHALVHSVDELVVVDHASSDGTLDGLDVLAKVFGDRLKVLRLGAVAFRQEAIVAWALERLELAEHDWLYVLDADEFLLTSPTDSLHEVLARLPDECSSVRYSLDNFVAPRRSSGGALDVIGNIRERAVACVFVDLPGALLAEQVDAGDVNFFDLAFKSKIIARNLTTWLTAGAHEVAGQRHEHVTELDRHVVRAAHVPMISRARLDLRAEAGRRLEEAGFDRDHGWQSQLTWRLQQQGRLDEFWQRHSSGPGGPHTVSDNALARSMEPVMALLAPYVDDLESPRASEHREVDASVDDVFRALSHVQRRVRGFLEAKNETIHEEQDELIALRGQLAEALRERDELERDRAAMRTSATWRIGSRIVRLVRIAKRFTQR